jgi:hypothetical protein
LQRNKVKDIVGKTFLIHSVDSLRLAEEISKKSVASGNSTDVLIEVKTTTEETKFGVEPKDVENLIHSILKLPRVNVQGLMTIGLFDPDPEKSRRCFQTLGGLRARLEQDGMRLPHLSMGMSNDFEVAIEEGSTIVRIGTALFGQRVKTA